MSMDMTLPNRAIFTIGVCGDLLLFFVGSSWIFVSGYIKNVDAYHVSFSKKKQRTKTYRD